MTKAWQTGERVFPWVLDDADKVVLEFVDDKVHIGDTLLVLVDLVEWNGQELVPDVSRQGGTNGWEARILIVGDRGWARGELGPDIIIIRVILISTDKWFLLGRDLKLTKVQQSSLHICPIVAQDVLDLGKGFLESSCSSIKLCWTLFESYSQRDKSKLDKGLLGLNFIELNLSFVKPNLFNWKTRLFVKKKKKKEM